MRKRRIWSFIITIVLCSTLLYLLFWRWQVAETRFFDVDEFSYLHWAANIARGMVPYRDFFLMVPPGFFGIFSLVVNLAGIGPQVFIAGRMVTLAIFFAMVGLVALLFGETRNWRWAILAAAIFAFLPMPYDKFLEIRPDNLAALLAFTGLVLEVLLLMRKITTLASWSLVGFLYAASLLVLPKTLPFAAMGGLVVVLFSFFRSPRLRWEHWKEFICVCLGFFIPFLLVFLWLVATGTVSTAWYSITRLPFEVFFSAPWGPMEPNLFFLPNASFYGGTGHEITLGLIVNHALWLLAIFIGAHRVLTPFHEGKKERALVELLIGGVFFLSIFGYVKFFPLKHTQYLIPMAFFVAYYAADGLSLFFDWLGRAGGFESAIIVLIGFAYLLGAVTQEVNAPKLRHSNVEQMTELTQLIRVVPPAARVVDLEGKMIFWRDGYPICCLPFDVFLPDVSHGPVPLADYLSRQPADYIYDGDSGRLATLSRENYSYIKANFAPMPGWGSRLWKKK